MCNLDRLSKSQSHIMNFCNIMSGLHCNAKSQAYDSTQDGNLQSLHTKTGS